MQIPGDKILGLAKFLLSIGVPGSTNDLFNQIDSVFCLENNRQVNYDMYSPASVIMTFQE